MIVIRGSNGKLVCLHKRMSTPAQTASDLYLSFLNKREEAERSVVPSEQNDLLVEAVQQGHQIIERLALFGAALNSNFVAIEKKLAGLEQTHPAFLKQVDEHLGGLIGLRKAFLGFYDDEAAFCAKFEQMVRTKILVDAGIDPSDTEASLAHLINVGKAQAQPPADPSHN